MWRKGNPFAQMVWVQTGAATVESSVGIPPKVKNGSVFWPSDLTAGNISERTQNINSKEPKHLYVHCSIIYKRQDREAAQVSISRWVDKTTTGHAHIGILLGHKKEETFTLCNSMDGPGEHYAMWNKQVRDRQIPYNFTHLWKLMNRLNDKQNRDRLIDGEQDDSYGLGALVREWRVWAKRKKDSWTTVWWLLQGGEYKGTMWSPYVD